MTDTKVSIRMRQSTMGDADTCLRRLQFKTIGVDGLEKTNSAASVTGTGYHGGLEHFYRTVKETGEFPGVSECVDAAWVTFDHEVTQYDRIKWNEDKIPDADVAHLLIDRMVRAYFDNGHAWPLHEGWKILGVEERFDFPFYETAKALYVASGSADLVLCDPNGWIVVDDHKTAGRAWDRTKHKPRKNIQSAWYRRWMREQFPRHEGYRVTFSIMEYNGRFDRRIADPDDRHEQVAEMKARATANLIDMMLDGWEAPTNPSSNLCSANWCDFYDVCPSGARLDT